MLVVARDHSLTAEVMETAAAFPTRFEMAVASPASTTGLAFDAEVDCTDRSWDHNTRSQTEDTLWPGKG